MYLIRILILSLLAGSGPLALSQTIDCSPFGQLVVYEQTLQITLSDGDVGIAKFLKPNENESVWRAERWQSTITIPDLLMFGEAGQIADVEFKSDGYGSIVLACARG
jgi:hypothetical protein